MQDITYYRDKIDEIDQKIIDLLADRFTCVEAIGELKKLYHTAPLQPNRWESVISGRKQYAQTKGISPDFIEELWDTIHEYALELQK